MVSNDRLQKVRLEGRPPRSPVLQALRFYPSYDKTAGPFGPAVFLFLSDERIGSFLSVADGFFVWCFASGG